MTQASQPCISAVDQSRLVVLIETRFQRGQGVSDAASRVLARLRSAKVVPPDGIPPDQVTMNSTVVLEAADGTKRELTLVYPEDHDPDEECWSILHPVGAALFGVRVGERIEVPGADGVAQEWTVAALPFQPESKGWAAL